MLQLSELVKFYKLKLKEQGGEAERINAAQLKERVLNESPELITHSQGKEVRLV